MVYNYKANLVVIYITLILLPFQAIAACPENVADLQSLTSFWSELIQTVNQKDPQKLLKLYQFPLKITGASDQDRDISLSQKDFIQYYEEIFVSPPSGEPSKFSSEINRFRSVTFDRSSPVNQYFKNGCFNIPSNVFYYTNVFEITWDKVRGWRVTAIGLDSEYWDVKPYLRSKKALVYWKSPKKQ